MTPKIIACKCCRNNPSKAYNIFLLGYGPSCKSNQLRSLFSSRTHGDAALVSQPVPPVYYARLLCEPRGGSPATACAVIFPVYPLVPVPQLRRRGRWQSTAPVLVLLRGSHDYVNDSFERSSACFERVSLLPSTAPPPPPREMIPVKWKRWPLRPFLCGRLVLFYPTKSLRTDNE